MNSTMTSYYADWNIDVSNCIELVKRMMEFPKEKEYLIKKFKIDDFLKENDVYDEEYTINEKIKRWFDLILNVSSKRAPDFILGEYYDGDYNNRYKIDVNNFDLCDISKIFWCYHAITDQYYERYYIIGEIDCSFIFVEIFNDTYNSNFIIRIALFDRIEKFITYGISEYTRQKILNGDNETNLEE
jgi:hypothetical protein